MISKEVQNQLNIIASILRLTDLHENASNYGVVERRPTNEERQAGADDPVQVLKIVDFRVIIFNQSNVHPIDFRLMLHEVRGFQRLLRKLL